MHVGGCYAAGKRRRPARRSTPAPHLGRARLHPLQTRCAAPHPRLTRHRRRRVSTPPSCAGLRPS
ncbi:hypothetical protein OG840_19910 [Streptomyces sp. NBC_01764]|nr:hypothetical protein [Streptomyces sp. NBC_01764]MCX4403954.1 hypothetical protein [Streptomyces sp. NBC_01764]